MRILFRLLAISLLAATTHAQDEKKPSLFDKLIGPATEENDPSDDGGLFGKLKKLVPEDADAIKDKLDDAWDRSKDSVESILETGSETDEKIEEMLSWLDGKLAGREPAYTAAEIEAFAEKIAPLVVELNGRQFEDSPKVEPAGNLQMVQILARDLAPQFEKRMPESSKAMVYLRSYLAAGLFAPALLGKYGMEDGTVYILPQNIEIVMDSAGIDAGLRDQIVQIVIGHELTHKLQDQEIGLRNSILAAETDDEVAAFNATIEGHAVFSQNAIADKLGFGEAAKQASELFVAGDLDEDAWLFERVAHAQAVQFEQIYAGGERFIRHHLDTGGMDGVWNILAAPPKRSAMITKPASYTENPPPLPDYGKRLAFLKTEVFPEPGNWDYSIHALGDIELRSLLAEIPSEDRETLMRGLKAAATVEILHETDIAKSADVALFSFELEKQAILMARTADTLVEREVDDLEDNSFVEVDSRSREVYDDSDLKGVVWEFATDTKIIGESTEKRLIVRRGSQVAVLSQSNAEIPTEKQSDLLVRALDAIRYE